MSLSIDRIKVEELLKMTGDQTSLFNPIFPIDDRAPFYPTNMAGGFLYSESLTPDARGNLLNLRKRIETTGIPLLDSEELDAEIRESRR